MALGGLSENWLFKELGDMHWQMIGSDQGLPINEVCDTEGHRLLPVFSRIRIENTHPLRYFKENDSCKVAGDLARFDEKTFISDIELQSSNKVINAQLMTFFARKTHENALILSTLPLGDVAVSARQSEEHKAFYREFTQIKKGQAQRPDSLDHITLKNFKIALAQKELFSCTYELNPYYDINGACLLYFASYPPINDQCERLYFREMACSKTGKIAEEWCVDSSTLARDIFYFGNCRIDDSLLFQLDSCEFAKNYRVKISSSLFRQSDGMLIARIFTLKQLVNHENFNCLWDDEVSHKDSHVALPVDLRVYNSALIPAPSSDAAAAPAVVKPVESPTPDVREESSASDSTGLTEQLTRIMANVLEVISGEITPDTDLRAFGLDSLSIMTFATKGSEQLGLYINPSKIFQFFTIEDIARALEEEHPGELKHKATYQAKSAPVLEESPKPLDAHYQVKAVESDIAVIGIAGRFPGADSVHEFWENLVDGNDVITEIPLNRWDWRAYYGSPNEGKNRTNINRGGFLSDIRRFDHSFFKISPKEAELMDPQQRLFLEVAWEVFEDAGYDVTRMKNSLTGVFVGVCHNDYKALLREHLAETEAHESIATSFSIIPNRVSFYFGFQGPSIAVDTMCSSSLVAVDQAVQALRTGQCAQALVGGVNLICHPRQHLAYTRVGVLSPEGKCRTFDDGANGYVRGEGVCALLLKPLARAEQDGDNIYAVIKGIAANHGGPAQSLTAPNADAQSALLVRAYESSGIDPATVSYFEAHGTGTVLGDPIEVSGIQHAFDYLYKEWGHAAPERPHCGLGSVKTSIGHLEAAAGIAGMLKVILAMKHGVLPPTRNFHNLNRMINLAGSPFYIQSHAAAWERLKDAQGHSLPRRAGVSSFGMGGTNAHVVIEEHRGARAASTEKFKGDKPGQYLIILSAKTREALHQTGRNLSCFLERDPTVSLDAISYTLKVGRRAMEERAAFFTDSIDDCKRKLELLSDADRTGDELMLGHKSRPSEAISEERLRRLIREKDFVQLARVWVAGAEIDWSLLYSPEERPRKVSLPPYPFSRTQHWISGKAQRNEEDFLVKFWQVREAAYEQAAAQHMPGGKFLVLTNERNLSAASALFRNDPRVETIVIECADLSSEADDTLSLLAEQGKIGGVIDLSDLFDRGRSRSSDISCRVALLQQLIQRDRLPGLVCLHLTRGLQVFESAETTLAGAEIAGLYRMLGSEYGSVKSRTVDLDFAPDRIDELERIILRELSAGERETEVCYRDGIRYCAQLRFLSEDEKRHAASAGASPFSGLEQSAVVITGGTGGIGLRLAQHLVSRGARHLALLGRRPLPERGEWAALLKDSATDSALREKLATLVRLEEQGAKLHLHSGSLTAKSELAEFFEQVRQQAGTIGGVFHCAGLIKQSTAFINKSLRDFDEVCEPKVRGLEVLSEVLHDDPLGFFLLFSSISAAVPRLSVSYSDYATANSFMDYFAQYQASQGNTIYRSLQWPLWEATGMGRGIINSAGKLGFHNLQVEDALGLLESGLRMEEYPCQFPCVVDNERVNTRELLLAAPHDNAGAKPRAVRTRTPENGSRHETQPESAAQLLAWLTGVFARLLKMEPETMSPTASFYDFGVDSLLIAQLVQALEKELSIHLDPTALQQHPSLNELSLWLAENHRAATEALLAKNGSREKSAPSRGAAHTGGNRNGHESNGKGRVAVREDEVSVPALNVRETGFAAGMIPIAVIGMACRFPGADDPSTFWKNLMEGKSHVIELPASRWNAKALYSPHHQPGKSISKWGGFLKDIEYFDADYFGFDERTALHLDPLVRMTLEVSAGCFRDAGYSEHEVSSQNIGVFVGARSANYKDYLRPLAREAIVGINQNFIAAHVSHFFNLSGPNMVIDTACSSSLVSVHLACQSLMLNETEMALAGGVDLLLDEDPYLLLSEGKALSPSGLCRTFDEKADGFVPGEGAGMLLLKRLDKAMRDGDRIHAVIEVTAVNNDGRTMGYTTPSANAQKKLVKDALQRGNIDPRTIGYVEAHGTGTMIGDPMELQALTSTFREYTQEREFCGVGSVKTNIGHLLSAAGVAGLMKVILCLQHRQLPPSLNCDTPNPRFAFESSPFFLVSQLTRMPLRQGVLRASVSSFGFGGTNAHAVLCVAPGENGAPASLSQYGDYSPVRQPLPPPVFNKKRFWFEKREENDYPADEFIDQTQPKESQPVSVRDIAPEPKSSLLGLNFITVR
jgi:probable biosynthetic protein (TIGR04098 family)